MFKVLDNKEVIYGNINTKEEALEYIEECKAEDKLECDSHLHNYETLEYSPISPMASPAALYDALINKG